MWLHFDFALVCFHFRPSDRATNGKKRSCLARLQETLFQRADSFYFLKEINLISSQISPFVNKKGVSSSSSSWSSISILTLRHDRFWAEQKLRHLKPEREPPRNKHETDNYACQVTQEAGIRHKERYQAKLRNRHILGRDTKSINIGLLWLNEHMRQNGIKSKENSGKSNCTRVREMIGREKRIKQNRHCSQNCTGR